jgi:hypothetical protein
VQILLLRLVIRWIWFYNHESNLNEATFQGFSKEGISEEDGEALIRKSVDLAKGGSRCTTDH